MNNFTNESFISFIKKAQVEELEELKTKLKTELDSKKKQLKRELNALEEKVTSEEEKSKKIALDKKKYSQMKSDDFLTLSIKHELAHDLFFEIVDKQLKNAKFKDEWMKKGLKKVETFEDGKVDKNLDEPGFVFENDNLVYEYTRSSYFGKIYQENKNKLIKVLFNE